MNLLTTEEIIKIHNIIIEETGGLKGISNKKALLMLKNQARQKVFGRKLYPSLFKKAAFYARTISGEHIFVDGNKRTSITVIREILRRNNYIFKPPKGKETEDFALEVAKNKLSLGKITNWIKEYSEKV